MGYHMANGEFADVQNVNLLASAARASTGSGDALELGDRAVVRLTLAVTAASSPTSLDVTIETSRDGVTWYDAGTFAQVTDGSETESKVFAVDRFVRASWDITGTSFTFSVSGEAA